LQPLVEVSSGRGGQGRGSFEQGYSAGWDDAVAAQQDDQGRIRTDLARNLQSLPSLFRTPAVMSCRRSGR
jgi:hypothetical protein